MQTIEHDGRIIAIVYRDEDWVKGLNFITPGELFIQVGSWWYDRGRKLDRHVHNDYPRTATRTQECVYVRSGAMRVDLYSEAREPIGSFELREGDLAVFAWGGHGYEILEDDTRIIETKNGPFIDVDTDKTRF
ncbi:MAG: hypothetical protein D6832_03465 [Alphaproteobacteria bacterium]|nr:MAG: hypothetical protein D6832_03465 [Alphaproteobacteria bacterium]